MEKADPVLVARPDDAGLAQLDEAFASARGELLAICRPIVGDDAEDVVHEAYLQARAKRGQLRDPDVAGAWMAKIAINLCFQQHRRRGALLRLLPRLQREQHESNRDLRDAVAALPVRDRTVVVLFYSHGLSAEEIATLLDLKEATVRSLLFRARARLRKALEPTGPTERGRRSWQ